YYQWNKELDQGRIPEGIEDLLREMGVKQEEPQPF
ncbi:jg15262, partial [Pararge aegeria aegeria]